MDTLRWGVISHITLNRVIMYMYLWNSIGMVGNDVWNDTSELWWYKISFHKMQKKKNVSLTFQISRKSCHVCFKKITHEMYNVHAIGFFPFYFLTLPHLINIENSKIVTAFIVLNIISLHDINKSDIKRSGRKINSRKVLQYIKYNDLEIPCL